MKPLPTAHRKQLGKHTDRALAKAWGVSYETVRRYRVALGIKSFKANHRLNKQQQKRLGKQTDQALAELWGVPRAKVRNERYRLGIDSFRKTNTRHFRAFSR